MHPVVENASSLEVIEAADDRLDDASGTPLTEEALDRCETWLRGVSIG